ncbi:MAG TPA: hypothetical protein VNE40_03250 [Candidatus Dormibacteraeota bacterium]|nr:hypothetical protein [Candidatus Dormibacteraeota bacterium]
MNLEPYLKRAPLIRLLIYFMITVYTTSKLLPKTSWLGIWFLDQTFDSEVNCDVEEIRQLIDGSSDELGQAQEEQV